MTQNKRTSDLWKLEGSILVPDKSRTAIIADPAVTATYGTTIAIDTAIGTVFSIFVSDTAAFTISSPTVNTEGREIVLSFVNVSGGSVGVITWGSAYKFGAAWTSPAFPYCKFINFRCLSGIWLESFRSAADVSL